MLPQRTASTQQMVAEKAPVALILIDVINDLEWPGGDQCLQFGLPMARQLLQLKKRAREAKIPVIYVNDNFQQWRSDVSNLLRHCLQENVRGRPIVEQLQPDECDYFVLKPKHSGFFSTTLDVMLEYLGAHTLILTGIAGDICVLFTANDAYMREYKIVVPADCVASNTAAANATALDLMQRVLKADITESEKLDLAALRQES